MKSLCTDLHCKSGWMFPVYISPTIPDITFHTLIGWLQLLGGIKQCRADYYCKVALE